MSRRLATQSTWPDSSAAVRALASGMGSITTTEAAGPITYYHRFQFVDTRGPAGYSKAAASDYQRDMRNRSALVLNHSAPRLSAINLERMKSSIWPVLSAGSS